MPQPAALPPAALIMVASVAENDRAAKDASAPPALRVSARRQGVTGVKVKSSFRSPRYFMVAIFLSMGNVLVHCPVTVGSGRGISTSIAAAVASVGSVANTATGINLPGTFIFSAPSHRPPRPQHIALAVISTNE